MVVSDLITAIRKLVLDESSVIFSDTQIRRLIGMFQQDFCVRSECYVKILRLAAPPQYQYGFSFAWEEGMLGDERVFHFTFTGEVYASTQPWELEKSYAQSTAGGNTLTGGADLEQVDPQRQIPYPLGEEVHKVLEFIWDYNVVEQKSKSWIENNFRDSFSKRGDIVDYFAFKDELRKDSLLLYGMPYTFSNITSLTRTPVDYQYKSGGSCPYGYTASGDLCYRAETVAALASNIGYVFAVGIPSRPSATYSVFELNEPFIKYIGFGVASKLLYADTELRNGDKAEHFKIRYEAGISIVRRASKRGLGSKNFRVQDNRGSYLRSHLSPPRLPDHYPRISCR